MNTRRRLALLLVALPLASYAYACSSDDSTPATTDAGGGGGPETGGPDFDGSMPGTDSSMPGTDGSVPDAADASDGAMPETCIGNPLTADGGTLDGGVDLDAAVLTEIVTVPGNIFLDGPQWLDANGGYLVYSQYLPTAQIERVAADGGAHGIFRDAGFSATNGPLGSAFRNGLVITAVDTTGGVTAPALYVTGTDGGIGAPLSLGASGSTSPNDLAVGPNNNLYFTDGQYQEVAAGTTGLYRMYPDAAVKSVQANFPGRANGIVLSPDSTKLYVGVGSANPGEDPTAILVFTVDATGNVASPGTPFLTAADLGNATAAAAATDYSPDGMAIDIGGNLWIAEAALDGSAKGRIQVFSTTTKKKLGTIPFPTQRPTGVAFGGPDGKKLFVTTESSTTGGSAGVFTYVSRCAGVK